MNDPQRPRDSFSLGGWLMAELMLSLAMLFFAANSLGFVARSESSTPTPPPDWQATIEANTKVLADISATATAATGANDDAIPAAVVQLSLTAVAKSQREVEATAAAYATQAAQPTATLAPTSTPLPTTTPIPPTATPTPSPTPDNTLATVNADLESKIATMEAMPATTAPPTPTPDTCIETVNLEETELRVSADEWVGADDDERIAVLQRVFADFRGQRVGLSLTFGHDRDPVESTTRAREANALLPLALPDMFDSNSKYKEYTDRTGSEPDVAVSFGIYFMKNACT